MIPRLAPIAAALTLTACVPPVQQPLLTVSGRTCDARPVFDTAIPVAPDRAGLAILGAEGSCLATEGGAPTTYAAFALSAGAGPYNLEIASLVVPITIVRPSATFYDGEGRSLRTVAPAEFERNIIGLRAGVRATGSERWLVVAADQALLGQTFEVRLGQNDGRYQLAAAVPVIIMAPVAIPEPRRANGGIISLNGKIVVTASPLRTVN